MRSIFLWRILVIFLIALLLASLLMAGGFMYLSRDTYTALRMEEMQPEAEAFAQLCLEYENEQLTKSAFLNLTNQMMHASHTSGIIVQADGTVMYDSIDYESLREEFDQNELQDTISLVLTTGVPQQSSLEFLRNRSRALYYAIPVVNAAGEVSGAVLILKSPSVINNAAKNLNSTLAFTILLVVPLILFFSTLSARKVTEPLHHMSEVAMQMSQGDFHVRADEEEVGEVGLLARALNHLCDTLAQTIHQLRAEKSQLKAILASFTDGVAAIDGNGFLTLYNPALMQMLGAVRASTREELIADDTVWAAFDEVLETGKPKSMRHPLSNDRMLWITLSPISSSEGELSGVVGLFRDMTEVENVERSRSDYVQNISHELRTPLTAVRGLLEPLSDGLVKEEDDRQRYYKIMLREVLRMSRLITDMMQLSRLQAGTEYMEFSRVNIAEVLEDISLNYTAEAAKAGVKLELDIAPDIPDVLTDPDRVEQIVVILLSNALRYTGEGGTITLRAKSYARVHVSVVDTGCGIPEKDIEHIFDRFYTVDKSRKEGTTGLGLSIAHQMIDKLGERIAVQSKVGEGSCFTFTLKKYVSNAIALGPAQDDWDYEANSPLGLGDPFLEEAASSEDAIYEVLEAKEEKVRKPSEKKKRTQQ